MTTETAVPTAAEFAQFLKEFERERDSFESTHSDVDDLLYRFARAQEEFEDALSTFGDLFDEYNDPSDDDVPVTAEQVYDAMVTVQDAQESVEAIRHEIAYIL